MTRDRQNAQQGAPQQQRAQQENVPQTPPRPRRPLGPAGSLENLHRNPASSIRIRRLPSSSNVAQQSRPQSSTTPMEEEPAAAGRRRSFSEPQRYIGREQPTESDLARQRTAEPSTIMPTITEGQQASQRYVPHQFPPGSYHGPAETQAGQGSVPPTPGVDEYDAATPGPATRVTTGASAMANAGNAARQNRGLNRIRTNASLRDRDTRDEYSSDQVDFLDLVGK